MIKHDGATAGTTPGTTKPKVGWLLFVLLGTTICAMSCQLLVRVNANEIPVPVDGSADVDATADGDAGLGDSPDEATDVSTEPVGDDADIDGQDHEGSDGPMVDAPAETASSLSQ